MIHLKNLKNPWELFLMLVVPKVNDVTSGSVHWITGL